MRQLSLRFFYDVVPGLVQITNFSVILQTLISTQKHYVSIILHIWAIFGIMWIAPRLKGCPGNENKCFRKAGVCISGLLKRCVYLVTLSCYLQLSFPVGFSVWCPQNIEFCCLSFHLPSIANDLFIGQIVVNRWTRTESATLYVNLQRLCVLLNIKRVSKSRGGFADDKYSIGLKTMAWLRATK